MSGPTVRVMTARTGGDCARCTDPILVGDPIVLLADRETYLHARQPCWPQARPPKGST